MSAVSSDSPAPEPAQAQKHKYTIHTFIISWRGKHENAESIVKAVAQTSTFVSVIYSDPNVAISPEFSCPAIRRPNNLFFGDKFQTCLDLCASDILLIICADCSCNDWSEVTERCRRAIEQNFDIGVWAPLIESSDWDLDRTEIEKIPNSSLSIVAQTDSIVFGLTSQIADRIRQADLAENDYGWGIDLMFNYFTYSLGKISVVDRDILIEHRLGSNYPVAAATAQLIEFLKQLTLAEKTQSALLDAVVHLHDRIKEVGTNDPAAVVHAQGELARLRQRILGDLQCRHQC